MSESAENIVDERVRQLEEISTRRNRLLREMFHLIQRRNDIGSVIDAGDEDDEDVRAFLDRFDLQKNPETGHISNLPDEELELDFVDVQDLRQQESAPQINATSDSPMSEPPASPSAQTEYHEVFRELRAEDPHPTEADAEVEMETDQDQAVLDAPLRQSSRESAAPLEEEPESDDVLMLQPQPQRSNKRKSKAQIRYRSQGDESDPDELDLLRPPSCSSPPCVSSPSRIQSATNDVSRSHSRASIRTRSPVEQVQEEEIITASLPPEEPIEQPSMEIDRERTRSASQEWSEEHVSSLLRPSSLPRTSPHVLESPRQSRYAMAALPLPMVQDTFILDFDVKPVIEATPPKQTAQSSADSHLLDLPYPLPPSNILPLEFHRRVKPSKQHKKREKEREKGDGKREEWTPMGINRWGAVVRANPTWKKLSRSAKCLTTRDWSVGMTEVRLLRTLDRVEMLKESGRWSFRQPKKQRGVGGLTKTHWDYLLDEMKWMRIDFHEERVWKLALAYNLAHAVMDWHAAGTLEERVRRGICVLWKPPRQDDTDEGDERTHIREEDAQTTPPEVDDDHAGDSRETSTPLVDYASEDSDDEQEKERRDVVDALEPAMLLEEGLNNIGDLSDKSRQKPDDIQPKEEDVEDLLTLRQPDEQPDAMDVDAQDNEASGGKAGEPGTTLKKETLENEPGLKADSGNPMLGTHILEGDVTRSPSKKKEKAALYTPFRGHIVYSDIDKFFVDTDDLALVKSMSELSTEDKSMTAPPPPPDLSSIFPDLPTFGLLDVAGSSSTTSEGRKKNDRKSDKDDPNKRAEDTTYTRLAPVSKWNYCKPVLVSALQPSKHWINGRWQSVEEAAVVADFEASATRAIEENLCSLFDNPKGPLAYYLPTPPKDPRRRVAELVWTPQEDLLLKQIVERYPHNWLLVADIFNSARVTISTDRRTAWDCYDRWISRWGGGRPSGSETHAFADEDARVVPPTPTQMTTRGHKRSASISVAAGSASSTGPIPLNPEPRKRRRHNLMHDAIRKAIKKKEIAQKTNSNQRKPPAIHDTHSQYNKMPRLTPQDLSRMKAEKEARENQEMARRKHEADVTRQMQAQRIQAPNMQQQSLLQQQGQPAAPRAPGTNYPAAQVVPQIRSQVGISQQQRLSTPMVSSTARLSPSQVIQAQAQVAQAQAQAQAARVLQAQVQAQAQAQMQQSGASHTLNAANAMGSAHLSPSYAARTASSSPAMPHQSPPLPSTTPVNGGGVQRPTSAQPHAGVPGAAQGVAANAAARPASIMGHYYVPNLHQTNAMSTEQMENAMRIQTFIRNAATAASMNQNSMNGSYTQS
ncbi:hypothetical protein OBBRIDRAFT_890404 [Obba rivulosa]|uniref:Vacuolar import and degradation protein 21 n=1 Tax=Obba rivulosa TaxID=1052685 RepID=A0A8E2AR23_9APHY|nr:hypothetical protein OBBRIDRAFT_890404 [Obba rivulosa]